MMAITTPAQVAIFSGTVENDEMPSKAKLNSLPKRNLVSPMLALGDLEGHADRGKADPGVEPLGEARALGQGPQRIDHLAVEQAEIAGAFRQFGFAEAGEQR
jgi:hypothetical protein